MTASGQSLIGGSAIAYTDKDGYYQFPALPPGTYVVKAELNGFQIVIRNDIRTFVGKSFTVDFTLEATPVSEVLEISGATPLIDVTTAAESKTVPVEYVEKLPKFSFALDLFTLTPGVGDLSYVAYGAGGSQANAYWYDGVDISNPVTGAEWVYPNYNWIEEVQVVGIGAPAEYGGFTGVVTNSVSRSGSNQFHGLFETFYQNSSLTYSNSEDVGLSPPEVDLFTDTTVQLGGPILKDKLSFFSGFQYYYNRDAPVGYPPDGSNAFRSNEQPRFINKLTYKYNQNNTLQGFIEWDDYNVTGSSADAFTLPEATATEEAPQWFWNLGWSSVLSNTTLLDVRTSGFNATYNIFPRDRNLPAHGDYGTGIHSQNHWGIYQTDRNRNQVNASISHHAENFIKGGHDFKFGIEFERSNAVRDLRYSGGIYYLDLYSQPYYRYLWEGYNTDAEIRRVSAFMQDSWNVTDKLNLSVGVRWDGNRSKLKTGDINYETNPVAPRVGLVYDLKGNQKTVIKGHYGRYYEGIITFFIDGINDFGDRTTQRFYSGYGWNTTSFEPGTSAWTLDDNIKQPYTEQFTTGIDQVLPGEVSLSAHYIYRRDRDLIEDVDNVGIYEPVPFLNPVTGETITVFNRLNPEETGFFITNPSGLFRRYHGVEVYGNKRFSNGLALNASFVVSKVEGNVDNTDRGARGFSSVLNSPNDQINNEGRLTHDPTFEFKLTGYYDLPLGINTSWYYRHFTGDTWTPIVQVVELDQGRTFIFALPRGSNRFHSRNILDVRFEKVFSVLRGELKFTADIFNVFNTGYVLDVDPEFGPPTFGQTTDFSFPRQVRLGIRYRF